VAEQRREPGGTFALLDLIEEHRGAFEYDWRTRFGMALEDVPERMAWDEVQRLTHQLALDPSSHVAASVAGWPAPWPREAFVLADLFDLMHAANSQRKPKPYPRPTDKQPRRLGDTTRSQRDIRAALAARGHRIGGGHDG